jgi:hypothetical protein
MTKKELFLEAIANPDSEQMRTQIELAFAAGLFRIKPILIGTVFSAAGL